MPKPPLSPNRPPVALLMAMAVLCAGCSSLPRIDPSGQRLLVWPQPEPAASTPQRGNLQAPPVLAQDYCPLCPGSCPLLPDCCPLGKDLFATSAAPYTAPVTPQAPRPIEEELSITPSRLLAPIGSEVILKAGVCNRDGYLRTNRRIEWMLDQQGTGQFVTVGEQGEFDMLRAPWQRPNKHDNSYAVGYTSPFYTCLRRGTDDPSDDVQVRSGEAWITVSSASEGVSYITAHAPESEHWDSRRATATVYWVDAQWRLPPTAVAQPGQSQTLTTVVTRQSDGAPIAGWTVRYEVVDGQGARLGYQSGETAEATTDNQGRASIEVSPTDDQPGAARVKVTVIRPAQPTPMASPQLELGGGETLVDWSPSAIPSNASPTLPRDTPERPRPPTPFEPAPNDRGAPIGPTPNLASPKIEVRLERDTSGPIRVGDPIPVTVTLLNTGDAPAQRILLTDEFDRGLSSPQDLAGTFRLQYPSAPDLAPGASTVIDLDFTATSPGQQCHTVTVTAEGMQPGTQRQCFDVGPEAPPAAPKLRIEVAGDAIREVGETYSYLATVYNDGAAAAENVRIEVLATDELTAEQATGETVGVEGGVAWAVPRIAAGASYAIEVQFRCERPATEARVTLYANADRIDETLETIKVEVRPGPPPANTPAPGPSAGPSPGPSNGFAPSVDPNQPLRGEISSSANPTRVGQSGVLSLRLTNAGAQRLDNIEFRLAYPAQIAPNLSPSASPLRFQESPGSLVFETLAGLAPGESYSLSVPFNAVAEGAAEVRIDMRTTSNPTPVSASTVIEVRAR